MTDSEVGVGDVSGTSQTKQTVVVSPSTYTANIELHEEIKRIDNHLGMIETKMLGGGWDGEAGLIRTVKRQADEVRSIKVWLWVIVVILLIEIWLVSYQVNGITKSLESIDLRLRSVESGGR